MPVIYNLEQVWKNFVRKTCPVTFVEGVGPSVCPRESNPQASRPSRKACEGVVGHESTKNEN